MNGAGVGVALAYAMTAYTTTDASCPKRLLVSNAVLNASQLGWIFAFAGAVAFLFSLAPPFVGLWLQWRRRAQQLAPMPATDELAGAWGGFLFVVATFQMVALIVTSVLFAACLWWALSVTGSQTPDVLNAWWADFEKRCEQLQAPLPPGP